MIADGKFLALDLELNQPSGRIIQVGVAIGDKNTRFEDYVVRKWYINPQEPISEFITDLTGITDSDIRAEAYSHEHVARELSELIKEHKVFINPVTWGGGDSGELLQEFSKNHADFPHFGRRWIDVKTWYTYLMLTRGKAPSGGLASVFPRSPSPLAAVRRGLGVGAWTLVNRPAGPRPGTEHRAGRVAGREPHADHGDGPG